MISYIVYGYWILYFVLVYLQMAKLLLAQPGIKVNIRDKDGKTELHYAVIHNRVEVNNYSQLSCWPLWTLHVIMDTKFSLLY